MRAPTGHPRRTATSAIALAALVAACAGAPAVSSARPAGDGAAHALATAAKTCPKGPRGRTCRKPPRSRVVFTLIEGSTAKVDFGPALGSPVFPLRGRLTGYATGRIGYVDRVPTRITNADVRPLPTDVFSDTTCGGVLTPSIRTNAASHVTLDPRSPTTATLNALNATVRSRTAIRIRIVLDLRNPAGCDLPPVTSGYADSFDAFSLTGDYGGKVTLTSKPHRVTISACQVQGDPAKPCPSEPTTYSVTMTVTLRMLAAFPGR